MHVNNTNEFVESLSEVFFRFGEIKTKRMFGGYGIYHQGHMFGLVADDELYLKADQETAPLFQQRGLVNFVYVKKGKAINMSYYLAPDEIFEDPEEACVWANHAFAAASRAARTNKHRA